MVNCIYHQGTQAKKAQLAIGNELGCACAVNPIVGGSEAFSVTTFQKSDTCHLFHACRFLYSLLIELLEVD